MIGRTLSTYMALHFLKYIVFIFLLFFALIMLVDVIELSRKMSKLDNVDFLSLLSVSFFRTPAFAENVLPFSVLFGASLSLTLLNKRLELVVARASGVSVWQFLMPLILVAIGVGVIAVVIYNPIAQWGKINSKAVEATIYSSAEGNVVNQASNFWVRLPEPDGDMVIRANVSQNNGTLLTGVTAYRFGKDNLLIHRIDAIRGRFEIRNGQNNVIFEDAKLTAPEKQVETIKSLALPVTITISELQSSQRKASNRSIWQLPKDMVNAERAGNSKLPFVTQIYSLASLPLLFVAMVLLAGTISLTFTRFGLNKKVILGGIFAGFVLYILTKLVITFGSNGLVPPFIATWTPALIATLISMTVLLYQEDG